MNRRLRRSQRKAPPLRGRAATLPSLKQSSHTPVLFTPLRARATTRQPPPGGGYRRRRVVKPLSAEVPPASDGHDHSCPKPSEVPQAPTPMPQWAPWFKRWGWFIGLALVIMAIAISLHR